MRRIPVFFYGLFIDAELLRSKGMLPDQVRRADLHGYSLRIGERAAVVPAARGRVCGMIMSLTHAELERLYSEESLRMYKPEPVICDLRDGLRTPALCFNLPEEPAAGDTNLQYVAKLRDLVARLSFPEDYVRELGAMASARLRN